MLDDPPRSGAENMARDEAIFEAVQRGAVPPTLRFFTWAPPCLSLGAFQSATEEVDAEACARAGVDLVRRPTGGRAILHDRELTYSVCASVAALGAGDSVLGSYHRISRALIAGLTTLGVPASLAPLRGEPVRPDQHSAACFDVPSDYEVLAGGRKLVGSAQMRRGPHVLQHGSILVSFSTREVLSLLRLSDGSRSRWEQQMDEGVTDLEREIVHVDPARLRAELVTAFARVFEATLSTASITPDEEVRSRELQREKYGARSWTFRL